MILILLDHRVCHVNPFQPVCLSSSGSDHFNIRKINYQFFSTVFASSIPSCLCFSAHPPLFFKDSDFLVKYPSIHVKSLHSFPSCSYPVILMKILTELQIRHSFSSSVVSSQALLIIPFLISMLSHAGAPLNHPLLAIQLFRSAQEISQDSCFHSAFVILSSSFEIVISF